MEETWSQEADLSYEPGNTCILYKQMSALNNN